MPINPNISITLPNDGDSGWGDTLNTAITNFLSGVNALSIPTTAADVGASRAVGTTVTSSFTAVANTHYPVNATSGNITITLPTGALQGSTLSAEREDATANTITFSGSIRGSASTVGLTSGQFETMNFIADSAGSWWPYASHKTRSFLDATYAKTGVITAGSVGSGTAIPVLTYNSAGQLTAVTTAAVTGGTGGASNATTSAPGLVQLAGDLGGTATSATAPVLKSVGTAGTYGSAASVPIITTDAQGRVTTVTTASALDTTKLAKASNLSDLASTSTALTNLGLNNVSNTSDANKPVSTAQASADSVMAFHVTPRLGWVAVPPGFISGAVGTPTAGTLFFYPFYVGNVGYTTDAFYTDITTAQSGGTTSFQVALYKDDGTGWPDGTQQAIAPQSVTLTSTGNIATVLGTPVVLTPGRYWILALYQVTTAPTTTFQLNCLSNTIWSLPVNPGTLIGTAVRGYAMASQTTFPSAAFSTTGVVPSSSGSVVPIVGLRRSA